MPRTYARFDMETQFLDKDVAIGGYNGYTIKADVL